MVRARRARERRSAKTVDDRDADLKEPFVVDPRGATGGQGEGVGVQERPVLEDPSPLARCQPMLVLAISKVRGANPPSRGRDVIGRDCRSEASFGGSKSPGRQSSPVVPRERCSLAVVRIGGEHEALPLRFKSQRIGGGHSVEKHHTVEVIELVLDDPSLESVGGE